MELPPVSASLGALGSLAEKLHELPDNKYKGEIERLGIHLVKLSKVRDLPVTARIWMKDVRELSYDMENCVDIPESDWIRRMSGFKARVKAANKRYDRLMLGTIPICTNIAIDSQLPTVGDQRRPDLTVVGPHADLFDKLRLWLTDDDKEAQKVASVVGVGGIGKTTLAKQLWREHQQGDYFHCRAFVRMAKKPDIRRILRSMLAQVRPQQAPASSEVHELIHDLREHLQDKRYFLIIDDLWATSVWDVVRHAFPEGKGSRILTTTEIEDVALACCSYQSNCIFDMEPLSDSRSKELFTRAAFGSSVEENSRRLDKVSDEIIRRCAGLPQAIISISNVLASQREGNTVHNIEQILGNLPTNTTTDDILKQVLNFCYNCLHSCLQTCLLYLSLYPGNYMILKEDIVKQWVGEGFIIARTDNEKMRVAGSYFDKLVNMGFIQHIYVDYGDEVLYYAVHHTVHDLITLKAIEENFVTVIDYSQRTIRFSNKISRLSLQFGGATHAATPDSIGPSQVRSLAFIGLKSCFPPILEFKVTCNGTVHLPDLMQGPKNLETLEINATIAAIPLDIVHLRSWLHLRLGLGKELPDLTGIFGNVTLNLPSAAILLKESSSPPDSVQTIELLPPICRIPKWIGQISKLYSLKIVVTELLRHDITNLQRLPALAILSLHVQRRMKELIGFATGQFATLEYFEFRCGVPRLMFQKGAMPNLQRLRLGFNARRGEQYGRLLLGIEDLSKIKEISAIIGVARDAGKGDFEAAESAFMKAFQNHNSNVSVKKGDMLEEDGPTENQHVIREKDASSEQPAIRNQESEKDLKKNASCDSQCVQMKMEHASVQTSRFSYDMLKEITYGFSEERLLGSSGYGIVYKGVHKDGKTIAVKLLYELPALDEVQFEREFNNLISLQHDNILRLLGYCRETRIEIVQYQGRMALANRIQRALCFEYAHNGSLEEYLYGEPSRDEWHMRFQMIMGICHGLNYLHENLINHLDLKPKNVMLDTQMKPKIMDFGLSRIFDEGQSRVFTQNAGATMGYMAPEIIDKGEISFKTDIFALGIIIIKLLTGRNKYDLDNWENLLEVDGIEAEICIKIAHTCLQVDQHNRPTMGEIVHELNELQNMITKQRSDTTSGRHEESPGSSTSTVSSC